MKRSNKRLFLCCSLLCLNLAFIWGNSLLPGEVSAAISGWVKNILAYIFPMRSENPSAGHGLLRKLAHFTEFAALGMLLSWLFGMLCQKRWKLIVFPLLCGIAAACLDEAIQCFVPGRGPGLKDVGIDTLGVISGIVIIYFIHQKIKLKYLEENKL